MRIDLFAVWFMGGLLSRHSEQNPIFTVSPAYLPGQVEPPFAIPVAGYSSEASSL
jgi:hypothetical protein